MNFIVGHEDRRSLFLLKVGKYPPVHTASQHRRSLCDVNQRDDSSKQMLECYV